MINPAFFPPAPLPSLALRPRTLSSRPAFVCLASHGTEMDDDMPSETVEVLYHRTKQAIKEGKEEAERIKVRVAERSRRTPTFRKMQSRHAQGPAAFRRTSQRKKEEEEEEENRSAVSSVRRRRTIREGAPLREIAVGAKFTGIVQNLVRHGAYVDVGAVKDGLVHVRDMSSDFVHAPEDLVRSGDAVDVWVKYVNPVSNVLGLTMVKPTMGFVDRVEVTEIKIGARYEGFVERVTNYGAYVDIGAERLGFLHVAAIWGRRPRETLNSMRIGQSIWVHVDDVDELRSHMKLRARGRGHKSLEKNGPVGDLAQPGDVVKECEPVVKSEVLLQRVTARPGEEEYFMQAEKERLQQEDEEDKEIGFEDFGDDIMATRPLPSEDISHMFDGNTEFVGIEEDNINQ